jgi:cell filamentation protein
MTSDPYCYGGSSVLINRFEILDAVALNQAERIFAIQRAKQGIPSGSFNLAHLKAIHHHLFQDIYDWAGEIRTVEIAKGGNQFQFCRYIETGMADVHGRLLKQNFLKGLNADRFAEAAGVIMGDINYIHPFREGNGRTQVYYLQQLCREAGYVLQIGRLEPDAWLAASVASFSGDYALMADCIRGAIEL